MTESDWFPIVVSLLPAVPLIGLLTIPSRAQPEAIAIASQNWGNIASVWGLGVSIYLISIARGARKAAQDARSGEKARTALQDLRQAAEKITHVGVYAGSQKWDAVQLRAEEVMVCCHSTVARWKDDPAFKDSSNDLLMVATQMRSIVMEGRVARPSFSLQERALPG